VERARNYPIEYLRPEVRMSPGLFDVLAGIDGSSESVAAVKEALLLFGGCVTSLTLAKVLDYDSGGSYTGAESRGEARRNSKGQRLSSTSNRRRRGFSSAGRTKR
jgi:hypothetical protein